MSLFCSLVFTGFIEGPEVPFRMTPNIETALGKHHIRGHFLRSMAMIAGAVKEHKEEFDPILRLLMRDDILAWYSKSMAKSDSKTQELERQLIERVSKNVHTLQVRFADCAPNTDNNTNNNTLKLASGEIAPAAVAPHDGPPIDQTVHDLFQMATDPERLCMMPASYHPWL
jgi:phosphatidylinositol kinase/protein kinase (PI-3  family)